MEHLQTLRDFTVGKISVEENDGVFEFSNGETIKGDTKTIYKRKNQQQFYNFSELYHYIKVAHIEKKTSKYVASCREKKFIPVPILQRKNMLQFFTGKTDTAPGIQSDTGKTDETKQASVPGKKTGAEKTQATSLPLKDAKHSTENTELASIFAGEVKNKQGSHLSASVGNFKIVLKLCQMAEALDRKKNHEKSSSSRKRKASDGGANDDDRNKRVKGAAMDVEDEAGAVEGKSYNLSYDPRRPIIIVPSTGIFTMHNAKEFLETGNFVVPEVAKKNRKPKEAIVKRKTSKGVVEYLVVDNVRGFSKNNWNRVVAVFAIGPTWQFKNWYWKTPAEIFAKCTGFHMKYDHVPVNPGVLNMKVKVCELSQNQRHRDVVASKIFWETLDRHISIDKPWYQPGNWKLK